MKVVEIELAVLSLAFARAFLSQPRALRAEKPYRQLESLAHTDSRAPTALYLCVATLFCVQQSVERRLVYISPILHRRRVVRAGAKSGRPRVEGKVSLFAYRIYEPHLLCLILYESSSHSAAVLVES